MPTPDQAVELRARVARARAVRELHEAVHAFAWRALERYRLSDADRKDVAQNVVIAAFQRREAYHPDRGAPGAWLWGLVRNEVRAFARGRQPELATYEALDAASEAPTPEESVSVEQLADHLLDLVPVEERRVVMLHEMFGLTFRDIAKLEGISPTQAHARHRAGMAALQRAVTRWKRKQEHRGVALLPITLASLLAPHRDAAAAVGGPPAEVTESAWRHMVAVLGIEDPDPADDAPPSSGRRRRDPAARGAEVPLPRPASLPLRWVRALGPLLGASLGGLVGGVALGRCEVTAPSTLATPAWIEAHAVPAEPAPPTRAAVPVEPATISAVETSPAATSVSPTRTAATATNLIRRAPRVVDEARDDSEERNAERALVDRARAALASENLAGGLAALAEHARRFPRGQHAAAREQLRAAACAEALRTRQDPALTARCSGQP